MLGVYSYFAYPLVLWAVIRFRGESDTTERQSDALLPGVTLIVTAYNEAGRIRKKLENCLEIDYPADRLEIIVASDCSSDATDAIVQEYADRGVKLVRARERLGKENAQREAIAAARGEIIVFSDTATEIPSDAIRRIVAPFGDPAVGAVSSEDRFVSQHGKLVGEGAYVRYEMWLRSMESRLAGLVGLSGSFFAARREVCQRWDIHSPSDFNTALNCARLGLKAVTAPDVHGYYQDLKDPRREFQRKVRTVIRGVTGLLRHADVLNPFRFGVFAFQVWSHKVMRWLVPWFLIALFAVTVAVASVHWLYAAALWAQIAFYGIAVLSHFLPALRGWAPARLIYFFVQVNVAIAQATLQYLAGRRMTTWQPSAR
ncbi:MAG: glycosyltransferase family 2 protein [Ectothiorhodospiraceae bacterium]|nr:glycosyltransferase family 2 protein [Ectothiorhodospiraceae bacterium]